MILITNYAGVLPSKRGEETMHNLAQTERKETSLEIDNKISRKEVIH
jgi:hypothetical protein